MLTQKERMVVANLEMNGYNKEAAQFADDCSLRNMHPQMRAAYEHYRMCIEEEERKQKDYKNQIEYDYNRNCFVGKRHDF